MYRDNTQLLTHTTHNFVLNHGALGDVITSLPALIHARRTHNPLLEMIVHVPPWQMDFIAHLLAPYGKFDVRDFSKFPMRALERKALDIGPVSVNQMAFNCHTRNRVSMVDYAFGCLTDSRPESDDQRNYPTAAPLGRYGSAIVPSGKYVVFPVGATSDNKLFRASVMAPVMEWCQRNGYAVVIVGTKASHTQAQTADGKLQPIVLREQTDLLPVEIFRQCIDLREKTTLLELRDVCGYADAVVGVDGGTLHVAGTTDVPIVYAMGTTSPVHRFIYRDGDPEHKIRYVVPRDLECAGCQSNWTMTTLDFRFCAYGDNLCMEKLHPEDFINGLRELGL